MAHQPKDWAGSTPTASLMEATSEQQRQKQQHQPHQQQHLQGPTVMTHHPYQQAQYSQAVS